MTGSRNFIRGYYERSAAREAARLDSSYRRIELAVWARVLASLRIASGCRILDLGCGPWPLSVRLGLPGENLVLVDFAASLLALSRDAAPCVCADAVKLPFTSDSFDLVLASGPFYHLPDAIERACAMRELHRVLRVGGVALVAGLNPIGVAAAKVGEAPGDLVAVARSIALQAKLAGFLPAGRLGDFPDAFMMRPHQLATELAQAGLRVRSVVGLQCGLGFFRRPLAMLGRRWPAGYRLLVRIAARSSQGMTIAHLSEHFAFVVEKR